MQQFFSQHDIYYVIMIADDLRGHGLGNVDSVCVCFFVLCNRHRFNRVPDPPPRDRLGVTYLPSTISSDAGYADLPLALFKLGREPQSTSEL